MSNILVVDDEESICWSFRELLVDEGHRVEIAASAEEAIRRVAEIRPDAVVLDVRLPGMDGLTALPLLRERTGGSPIVVMTAFGDLETAVRAVETGAFDYLVKPFDLDQVTAVVRRALEAGKRPRTSGQPAQPPGLGDVLVGSSPPMQTLFQRIALVASADVPVLITGESGTGKELVARALHRYGSRRDGPFVPVCLPALSPSLVEAELFGHAKGAFTGASQDRKGIFEFQLHGGTVLLDEIGDSPAMLQVKLLRAIENREIAPVGDARTRPVDIRVLAATNRLLPSMVASGTFREDLYFRLAAFPIRRPRLYASGSRGHPRPGRPLPGPLRGEARDPVDSGRRGNRGPPVSPLAGKRPGAAQRDRARRDPGQGRTDPGRASPGRYERTKAFIDSLGATSPGNAVDRAGHRGRRPPGSIRVAPTATSTPDFSSKPSHRCSVPRWSGARATGRPPRCSSGSIGRRSARSSGVMNLADTG